MAGLVANYSKMMLSKYEGFSASSDAKDEKKDKEGDTNDDLKHYKSFNESITEKNSEAGIPQLSLITTKEAISKKCENYPEIDCLFESKKYQDIVNILQDLIDKRLYNDVIMIGEYACKINSSVGFIYYFLGIAYNALGKYEQAYINHKKALELDQTLADINFKEALYKGHYDEENVSCIGCGSKENEVVWVGNQSLSETNKGLINPIRIWVRCKSCSLIYANPQPREDVLNHYYSIIAKEKFGGIYGDIQQRFEFQISMANYRLSKIETYYSDKGNLLDIGAGVGFFVGVALDRGWNAIGLEFTPEDCRFAEENFGIKLLQKNFYDFSEKEKYDIVTLFEVIEHLQYPLKDLKRINSLVKTDGMLVLATPIIDSLYGKKTKEKNVFWNVVTHLSYFSKEVLITYLREAGFEVLEVNMSQEGMGRMEFYCKKIKEI